MHWFTKWTRVVSLHCSIVHSLSGVILLRNSVTRKQSSTSVKKEETNVRAESEADRDDSPQEGDSLHDDNENGVTSCIDQR